MTEVLGLSTLLRHALPTGADGDKLAKWMLKGNYTYADWVGGVAAGVAAFNQDLVDRWGWLFFISEDLLIEYPDGGSVTEAPEITDTDEPRATHGTTISHMIDLNVYGDALGGTKRFFRDARPAMLEADIRRIVNSFRWRFEKKLLNRLFLNTEYTIGTSGYNVPFVRGTGGNVDFTPQAYDGEAFTSAHDHYIGVNSSSSLGYDHVLNYLAETIQEHGHEPPYTAIVARADVASYSALQNFVNPLSERTVIIARGGETSGAQFFNRDNREMGVIGGFESDYGYIELRATNRVPTTYAGMVKSYGQLDPRNALAVRVHPAEGFGAKLVPQTTNDAEYPLKQLDVEMEFGVGVGADRTNGAAACLVAGGSWSNPTIS